MLDFNVEKLEEAVENFYKVTKAKVTIFDKERKVVFSYPRDNRDFCSIVGKCPELKKECLMCDNNAMDICRETSEPYVYTCHMNLIETVNPIKINGVVAGYVMIGQKVEESNVDEIKKRIFEVSKKYEIDGNELLSNMEKLEKTDSETMEAMGKVMMMCTSEMYHHRIITKRGEEVPAYKIGEYIHENVNGDLSVSVLCRHFHMSKSKLYSMLKRTYGIGLSDYARLVRIEESKKALKNTTKSINQIAEDVGFSDANYFIRVFRKEEGVTPSKYRKMFQMEEK